MPIPVYHVDAFTDHAFGGNPAAVVLLDGEDRSEEWLQAVARELNLPATAFTVAAGGGRQRPLRWFSAKAELTLCGHGSLSAAHVLVHELGVTEEVVTFATQAGHLTARAQADGVIELDLPARAPVATPELAEAAAAALFPGGGPPLEVFRGADDLLVVVPSADDVARLAPDHRAAACLPARCVVVSGPAVDGGDFVSRVFAYAVGHGEDPVTGSAHCLLGPYWARRVGRTVLSARQISARGGDLRVEVRGDRVGVAGRAVTVGRGELHV